jgi:hypothetical protein
MAHDKVWLIGSKVCKSEKSFLRRVKQIVGRENFESSWQARVEYGIYSISEKGSLLQLKQALDNEKTTNERDFQLKTLLDELNPIDNAILHILSTYPTLESNERTKNNHLRNLNNCKFDINEIKKFISEHKNYYLGLSTDVEWIKSLLRIHNFRDCNLGRYYDYKQRKYITREPSDELKEAFKLAKQQLRKKK